MDWSTQFVSEDEPGGVFGRLVRGGILSPDMAPILAPTAAVVDRLQADPATPPAQLALAVRLLRRMAEGALESGTAWALEALQAHLVAPAPRSTARDFADICEALINELPTAGGYQALVGALLGELQALEPPPSLAPETPLGTGGSRARRAPTRRPHDYVPPPCPATVDDIRETIGHPGERGHLVIDEAPEVVALSAELRDDLGPTDSRLLMLLKAAARQRTRVTYCNLAPHMRSTHVVPLKGCARLERKGYLRRDRGVFVLSGGGQ